MVFWRTYRQTPNVFYSHVCVYHVCVDDCSCVWTYVYVCIVYTCVHDCVYVDDCSCIWTRVYVCIIACICGCKCMCVWYLYVCEIVHVYRYMWMYIWYTCVCDGSHVWMLCVFAQMLFMWSKYRKKVSLKLLQISKRVSVLFLVFLIFYNSNNPCLFYRKLEVACKHAPLYYYAQLIQNKGQNLKVHAILMAKTLTQKGTEP